MFCSCISNNLPVVNSFHEWNTTKEVAEDVLILFNVNLSVVWADLNAVFHLFLSLNSRNNIFAIPMEMCNNNTDHLSLIKLIRISLIYRTLVLEILSRVSNSFPQSHLLVLNFFHLPFVLLFLKFFFILEILIKEKQDFIFVTIFHGLLKSEHLIAYFITNLYNFVFVLEFFAASKL